MQVMWIASMYKYYCPKEAILSISMVDFKIQNIS